LPCDQTSDFTIEELINGTRPISLYLVVPPEEMSRLKALLRLMIKPDPEAADRSRFRETPTAGAFS